MVKGKTFSTLFISSWKYAVACANPKVTFIFHIFQKEM